MHEESKKSETPKKLEDLEVYKKYVANEALDINDAFKVLLLNIEMHNQHNIHEKAKIFVSETLEFCYENFTHFNRSF